MRNTNGRLSPLGAGIRRLWAELEIKEGRVINAGALAREATVAAPPLDGGPVQPSAPWGVILGRDLPATQGARLLHFFGVTIEECEDVGTGARSAVEVLRGEPA